MGVIVTFFGYEINKFVGKFFGLFIMGIFWHHDFSAMITNSKIQQRCNKPELEKHK